MARKVFRRMREKKAAYLIAPAAIFRGGSLLANRKSVWAEVKEECACYQSNTTYIYI